MALTAFGLALLKPYLPAKRVLSLGYPDLAMTPAEFRRLTGFETFSTRNYGARHDFDMPIPETVEAFTRMGTEVFRCVDVIAERGVEEIVDLNQPGCFTGYGDWYRGKGGSFDLVLDCGTTEHCANFWNATASAAETVADGGIIFHGPPLTMLNHGFFCVQPTFYYDLYTQNGWSIERMVVTDGKDRYFEAPRTGRFNTEPNMMLHCIARRHGCEPLRYPVQRKYLQKPGVPVAA